MQYTIIQEENPSFGNDLILQERIKDTNRHQKKAIELGAGGTLFVVSSAVFKGMVPDVDFIEIFNPQVVGNIGFAVGVTTLVVALNETINTIRAAFSQADRILEIQKDRTIQS